jgi:Protein of unknown function (DUF2997)
MSRTSITVTIDSDGNPKVEAHGFNGKGCTEATAAVEKALGVTAERKTKTEFYSTATTTTQTQTT